MIKLKKQLPYWTVLVVSISIATITQASILSINGWAERSYKSKILLAEFAKYLNSINALEWEGIAKKEINTELNEQTKEARISADLLLKKIDEDDNENENDKQIKKELFSSYAKYNISLQQELTLINEHQIKQAIQLDNEQVDPGFLMLNNQIQILSNFYDEQKQKAVQISNVEITVLSLPLWRINTKMPG